MEAESKSTPREPKPDGISVILLTKDCKKELTSCLKSLKPFLNKAWGDEIVVLDTGSTDDTPRIALTNGARVINRPDLTSSKMIDLVEKYLPDHLEAVKEATKLRGGFLMDFAAARQIVHDEAKNPLIFWIDSDDILTHGAELRKLAAEFFRNPKNRGLFMLYDYWYDTNDGAVITNHWRERIVRKDLFYWKGACHESLLPRDNQMIGMQKVPAQIKIEHRNHSESKLSDVRNYVILRHAHDVAAEEKKWLDPRWEFYLANACRGLKLFDEATKWNLRVLKRSGSRDDRHAAALNIAVTYIIKQRPWAALDWLWQAAKIFPEDPRNYSAIGRCYHELGHHELAVIWTEFSEHFPVPETLAATDPNSFDFYPTLFKALSLKELKDWPNAVQAAQTCARLRPEIATDLVHEIRGAANNDEIKKRVMSTLSMASSEGAARKMIQSLKPDIRKGFPEFHLEISAPQSKKHITWLCGATVEPWDGTSDNDGIGGSEKMVLQLSREFAKAGYKVDVYGNPKEENRYKTKDGVTYKPFQAFNPELERDIIIVWRQHGYLDFDLKARKIFVDLHDVQDPGAYFHERTEKVDGYLFKSEFHAAPIRKTHPNLTNLIVTRNGIDLSLFDWNKDEEGRFINPFKKGASPHPGESLPIWAQRNLKKVVYCSSADRGLLGVLRMWTKYIAENPGAELHCFYGFTQLYLSRAKAAGYQHYWDEQCERNMYDYMEDCLTMIDKINSRGKSVFMWGRVSHEPMMRDLQTAGVWIYPTGFPEISCMVAMEAQIAGAIPLISPTGALTETCGRYGVFVDNYDQMRTKLKTIIAKGNDLDEQRDLMSGYASAAFDVGTLADSWIEHFDA
jgi:glycosyltransferase involved in cell wall biosynthesis